MLLIEASGGSIKGRTRFQKLVFLHQQLSKAAGIGFKFFPWDYGPYSKELQEYLNALVSTALVSENPVLLDETTGKKIYEYRLTKSGRAFLDKNLKGNEGKRLEQQVRELWASWGTRALDDLILHVYSQFPEFTTRSKLLG